MGFDEVADELYGLAPGAFIAARTVQEKEARCAGDRDLASRIRQLGKPSTAAWLVNQLVREQPEAVLPLVDLGAGLRAAAAALDGPQLRDLDRQQHQLVHALVRVARTIGAAAGQQVSADAARAVEDTVRAALADDEVAERLRAGRLTRPGTPAAFRSRPRPSSRSHQPVQPLPLRLSPSTPTVKPGSAPATAPPGGLPRSASSPPQPNGLRRPNATGSRGCRPPNGRRTVNDRPRTQRRTNSPGNGHGPTGPSRNGGRPRTRWSGSTLTWTPPSRVSRPRSRGRRRRSPRSRSPSGPAEPPISDSPTPSPTGHYSNGHRRQADLLGAERAAHPPRTWEVRWGRPPVSARRCPGRLSPVRTSLIPAGPTPVLVPFPRLSRRDGTAARRGDPRLRPPPVRPGTRGGRGRAGRVPRRRSVAGPDQRPGGHAPAPRRVPRPPGHGPGAARARRRDRTGQRPGPDPAGRRGVPAFGGDRRAAAGRRRGPDAGGPSARETARFFELPEMAALLDGLS